MPPRGLRITAATAPGLPGSQIGSAAMKRIGDEVHIDVDEARGGVTLHVMRYVLGIGLALAILAMSAIWITAALSGRPANGGPVSAVEYALGG